MPDIADFDKPWTEMEKVPCVCGHARHSRSGPSRLVSLRGHTIQSVQVLT